MNRAAATSLGVRLEPDPAGWRTLLHERWRIAQRSTDVMAAREQLGLPTDRPVVMTGHQPIVFHPGVLAKYVAADALASRAGAASAWLVVDHDETDPGAIDVPTTDAGGGLRRRTLRLLDAPPSGVPAGCAPASPVRDAQPPSEHPFIAEGVRRIADRFRAHADARTLADQSSAAAFDLLAERVPRGVVIRSTTLASTRPFAAMVERMAGDPLGFIERYNAAMHAHPEAGVTPMRYSLAGDVYELPLWRLAPNTPRRRVYAHDLDAAPLESLAPRALLMTLVTRFALCDLFIHGAGGWEYDRVTDAMAARWLREPIAPMTLATVTLTLPLLDGAPPSAADAARAAWRAHRAAHDPAMLGDREGAEAKGRLLQRIEAAPRRSADRAAAFRAMHDALSGARERHAGVLAALREDASTAAAIRDSLDVANARDWAFPLYPEPSIHALLDEVASRFA